MQETTYQTLIAQILGWINDLIPLIVGLALLFFLWGLAKFVLRAGSEQGREEGKQVMLWGIIVLFVMVSVWGIVNMLRGSFEFNDNPPPIPSSVPTFN